MAKYPTRGVELVVPSNCEREITGYLYGVNFSRRNHDYRVQFHASGLAIERDGKKITDWLDLPDSIQDIILKTRSTYAATLGCSPRNSELPG